MVKTPEEYKFEASERALKNEIENNPISCPLCRIWQSGGDMSRALFKCDECGRRAKPDIHLVIMRYAHKHVITYNEAWDKAYNFLEDKIEKAPHHIYYDEDYFYNDLRKYFEV